MKLQQLRFFVAVIDHGLNITQAAEALYTSQPGVSKQIRLLESELGMRLFVRQGKRLEALTPAGERVADHARRVLDEVTRIKHLSSALREEERGTIRLATTHTQARYVLPSVIDRFRRKHAQVDFHLHQGTSEQIARMIDERQVDFALISGQVSELGQLQSIPIYQWDRVVLVPADHPLARHEGKPDLATLAEHPLVTYVHSDRPESSLMKSFNAEGLSPRIAFTARDADIIKTYVRLGLGVGIVASMAVDAKADSDLVALDATGLFPRLTTWLAYRDDLVLNTYHCNFIRELAPHLPDALFTALKREGPDAEPHKHLDDAPPLHQPHRSLLCAGGRC